MKIKGADKIDVTAMFGLAINTIYIFVVLALALAGCVNITIYMTLFLIPLVSFLTFISVVISDIISNKED